MLKLLTVTTPQTTGAALTTTSTPCGAISIEAHQDNTAVVYIGVAAAVTVAAGDGHRIEIPLAGSALPGWNIPGGAGPAGNNLAQLFSVSSAASQKLNIWYEDN